MYSKILTLFIFLFNHSVYSQMKYYDVNGNNITEKQFQKIKRKGNQLKVHNDSLQISKIIPTRSASGEINSNEFISKLSNKIGVNINSSYPTIIIYHPGKDTCNSPTSVNPISLVNLYVYKEALVNKITTTNFINIYKNKEGIETLDYLIWHKDPNQMVEKTFFVDHYPCSSFVILYNNKYRSYFGEFSDSEITKQLKKIISSSPQK